MSLLLAVYAPSFTGEYRLLLEREMKKSFPSSGGVCLELTENPCFSRGEGIVTFSPLESFYRNVPVVSIGTTSVYPSLVPDFYGAVWSLLSALRERDGLSSVSVELKNYPFRKEVERAVRDYRLDEGIAEGKDLVLVDRESECNGELDVRELFSFSLGKWLKKAVSLLEKIREEELVLRDELLPVSFVLPEKPGVYLGDTIHRDALGFLLPYEVTREQNAFLSIEDTKPWVTFRFSKGRLELPPFLLGTKEVQEKVLSWVEGGKAPSGNSLEMVDRVLSYLEEHYRENFGREEIALSLGCSSDYMERVFVRVLGLRLRFCLVMLRVEKAKLLLEQTERNVSEIVELSGFCDSGHFCRVFRKMTGFSPSEYRKTIQGIH